MKMTPQQRASEGGKAKANPTKSNNETKQTDTLSEVAKATGVSRATVANDVRLMKALDKLGISRNDYAAGKVVDSKGKKRSQSSILAEAFPRPATTPKTKLPMGAVHIDAEEFHAPAPPEEEPEPLVVDSTKPAKRVPKYVPSDAMDIWNVAKTHLDRILKNDTHREQALKEVIDYSHARLKTGPMAIILQQLPKISEAERQELSARLESLTPQKP
jgi:hypothetical protein